VVVLCRAEFSGMEETLGWLRALELPGLKHPQGEECWNASGVTETPDC